jgi:hypothetical protein
MSRPASRTAVVALAALAAASAAHAETRQDITIDSRAFVAVSAVGAPAIALRLARIVKDERCPARVLCVWAGPSVIEVEARSAGGAARLALSSKGGVGATFQGWRIELQYLEPPPLETDEFETLKPLEVYTARLWVSHR